MLQQMPWPQTLLAEEWQLLRRQKEELLRDLRGTRADGASANAKAGCLGIGDMLRSLCWQGILFSKIEAVLRL